jgi:hypothetical protein
VPTMVTRVELLIEVVGCPTVCRHCWAQGVAYQAMPLGDVAWVLEQAHRFCDEQGLGFSAYPMHEVAAHPQAAEILRLFADHVGAAEFEPLATTGVPLAVREDWRELLAAAAELVTTTVWVAFHGVGEEHDRQVNRPGAYAETCLAIQRVHAVGLRVGCNVFVTKANAPQAERLLDALQRLYVDGMWWGPATYYPTARGRRNERLRPELAELLPIADRIRGLSPFDQDVWANLEAHTEAAWARRAGRRLAAGAGRGGAAPRRPGAPAGLPPQPRPAHRHGRSVPRAARQPARRRWPSSAQLRARAGRAVHRRGVVRARPAAGRWRAGRPARRPNRAGGSLHRSVGSLSVAGPGAASPPCRRR